MQSGVTAIAQPRFTFDGTPGVLPKEVVPSRYALTLDLDPAREEFSGKASIAISVRKSVASIVVHAHELVATAVSLTGTGGARPLSVSADPKTQTWRLAPDDAAPIAEGNYTLDIAYTGVVHRSGEGLYRADYTVQGKPTRMLATQLEARFARTLFPGFDEPVFRAVFDIAVRALKEYDVVSNMPISSKVSEGNTYLHRFQPTPPMSSYLVTVAVGRKDSPFLTTRWQRRRCSERYAQPAACSSPRSFPDWAGCPGCKTTWKHCNCADCSYPSSPALTTEARSKGRGNYSTWTSRARRCFRPRSVLR